MPNNGNKPGCCLDCLRWTLFVCCIFNIVYTPFNIQKIMLDPLHDNVPGYGNQGFAIVMNVFNLLSSLFGAYALYTKNPRYLRILALIMLAEGVFYITVALILHQCSLSPKQLEDYFKDHDYKQNTALWDYLQSNLKCCGLNGPGDYNGKTPASCPRYAGAPGCLKLVEHAVLFAAMILAASGAVNILFAIVLYRLAKRAENELSTDANRNFKVSSAANAQAAAYPPPYATRGFDGMA